MPDNPAAPQNTAERVNLHRLFVLRNIAILGQVIAVYISFSFLDMRIPVISLGVVIALLAIFNIFTRMRLRWGGDISPLEFLLQLSVDVLILTALLYQTGGATNPFVLLFLLPIIIATVVLPAKHTWALTLITAACYSLLMWKYIPLPHAHDSANGFSQHVVGMWISFVVSAAATAYFVVGMRKTLRSKDKDLASAREKQIRDEQLVTLGTLAASTAHELGTPLGTMALIADELEHEITGANDSSRDQLQILKEQISRCKSALASLSDSAGTVHLTGGSVIPVDKYLQDILDEWALSRPATKVQTSWKGIIPTPSILSDRTLNQALINILDNAADASSEDVEWLASWDMQTLTMEINDRGEGLSHEAKQLIGIQPYSAKDEGLGLGLFLAHSVINRCGGSVSLHNRQGGGVTTHISLPLTDSKPTSSQ